MYISLPWTNKISAKGTVHEAQFLTLQLTDTTACLIVTCTVGIQVKKCHVLCNFIGYHPYAVS
jgi:hypothetical protein